MYEYLQTVLRVEKRDAKGRIVRTFPRRELELLAKLSKYTTKGEMGQKLVDLLLPFLASGKGSRGFPAARSSILLIIREMVPKLDEPRRVVSFLSRQFLILTDAKDRLTLVGIFQAIGQRLPDLESVGDILAGLNAMEAGRVASADYGKRMDAYELLNNRFLEEWDATQLNPVLHSIVSDLRQEEMGLRMASSHALITTIQKLALEPAAAPSDGPPSTNDKVFLLHSVLFPALKNGLKTSEEPSRRETVKVLAALVRAFPVHYHHLLPLTHVNPDLDFFENILHIQMHRRRKALQRLRITLGGTVSKADAAAANADPSADPAPEDEGDDDADNAMVVDAAPTGPCTIDSTAATHVLIPLVQLCCFQATEQALVTEAVMTLGALAGLLGWSAYNNLVTSTIVRIRLKPEMEKVLIRVLCAVVDHFSFDLTMDAELVTAVVVVKEVPVTAMVIKGDDEDDEEELEDVTGQEDSKGEQAVKNRDALAAKIRAAIGKNLIPQLRDLISPKREGEEVGDVKETGGKKLVVPKHGKSQDAAPMIRVPVAMALIKLVKKLPEDLIQIHLPRLLTVLVKQLASRNQTARDVTRNTLVSMLETMGPKYLWFMLTEMHEILTRGYQLHVLGYVVHSLLFSLTNTKAVTGCVSASLNLLTRILMQDLVGETGKEKDVEKIKSSMREGRVLAPDSFEMLAALVDFGRDVDGLLDPLKEALAEAQGLTAVRHLTATLSRVAIGLQLNSSVTPETLLVFLHGTMTGAMSNGEVEVAAKTGGDGQAMSKVEMKARLRVTKEQTMMVQKMPKKDSARDPRRNQHTLIIFALQLLHTCFKRNRFEVQAAHILGMLDPFVGVIVDGLLQIGVEPPKAGAKEKSLRAASQGVITASLKALCYLLRTPLPSVAGMVPGLTGFLFELLRYGDQSLLHACCQCMAAVLRHCPTLELADEQVRFIKVHTAHDNDIRSKQMILRTHSPSILCIILTFVSP
jgi:U3 small nucleolar RNA-associated protein 20